MIARLNNELLANLGNFVNRALAFTAKQYDCFNPSSSHAIIFELVLKNPSIYLSSKTGKVLQHKRDACPSRTFPTGPLITFKMLCTEHFLPPPCHGFCRFDGQVPEARLEGAAAGEAGISSSIDKLSCDVRELTREYVDAMEKIKLREGIKIAMSVSSLGNKFFQVFPSFPKDTAHGFFKVILSGQLCQRGNVQGLNYSG